MEKIPGACAMEWSIELEKGLRSRKPGHLIQSINLIGPKLKQWSRYPLPTMAVYDMYGLIPGEDRLFADAILLRLADTFVSGDKVIKISVIRAFLSSLRYYDEKDEQAQGIFSNMGKENRIELLRRVKVVLTSENDESRALALILLGCCAEIAKDVPEMRHYILSTLSSCHVLEVRSRNSVRLTELLSESLCLFLEICMASSSLYSSLLLANPEFFVVKASLFAAGCFSEISDNFGFVCLESLLNLMNSPKTLPALKIKGARTFSKMGCSMLLAMKSYKAGAELVRKTLEDDLLATMLISLTKLSLKTTILISEQVGLLSSFLAQETSSRVQATALKCFRSIVEKAACFLPNSDCLYMSLFKMLKFNMSSALRNEVLAILLKMIAYGVPDILLDDFDLFTKLLRYVQDAILSSIFSSRLLAFQILVCISNKLKGSDKLLLVTNPATFLSGVVLTICDQIASLVRPLPGGNSGSEVVQELRSLFKLLLSLAKNHSELGVFILDKIDIIIKNMDNLQDHPPATQIKVHKLVIPKGNQNISIREVMLYIFRFLVAFLETLDDAISSINEIACKLKQLVSFVSKSSLFDCSIHTLFSLLHSLVNSNLLSSESQSTNSVQGLSGSSCNLLESESVIYECANNMLEGGDNWWAYKSGSYAACDGEWSVASFMFQHLEARVQSDINCQWLKFLVQFTCTEKNVKLLFQQVHCSLPLDHSAVQYDLHNCPIGSISNEYIKKVVDTFSDHYSSDKVLDSLSLQTQNFCFQRWLLALRLKVLLVLVDLFKILNGCLVFEDGEPVVHKMKGTISSLAGVSARLASVVEEYDLISTSFVDLDTKSLKMISTFGFCCSVLSFCVEFTYLNSNLLIPGSLIKESGYQESRIMKGFASRLWHIDSEMCFDLMSFLKEFHMHEKALPFQFGFQIPKVGILSKDILRLCRYSVKQLIRLQNKCSDVNNEDTLCQVYKNSMQLLSNIVGGWMHIPFRVPKSFFRVRPTVGCLLTSVSSGTRKQDKTFVSQGSHLALNLCIQLKNVTSAIRSRISNIHCILSCRSSFLGNKRDGQSCGGKGWIGYQASETDTMIDLNKKLQCQVMMQTKEFMDCGDNQIDPDLVETCVCFKTNGGVQGFSTCLLDVSAFPVGSYRIQWLSGAVDHQGTYWTFLPLNAYPEFSVI